MIKNISHQTSGREVFLNEELVMGNPIPNDLSANRTEPSSTNLNTLRWDAATFATSVNSSSHDNWQRLFLEFIAIAEIVIGPTHTRASAMFVLNMTTLTILHDLLTFGASSGTRTHDDVCLEGRCSRRCAMLAFLTALYLPDDFEGF
jgi:hypothetical protein